MCICFVLSCKINGLHNTKETKSEWFWTKNKMKLKTEYIFHLSSKKLDQIDSYTSHVIYNKSLLKSVAEVQN